MNRLESIAQNSSSPVQAKVVKDFAPRDCLNCMHTRMPSVAMRQLRLTLLYLDSKPFQKKKVWHILYVT